MASINQELANLIMASDSVNKEIANLIMASDSVNKEIDNLNPISNSINQEINMFIAKYNEIAEIVYDTKYDIDTVKGYISHERIIYNKNDTESCKTTKYWYRTICKDNIECIEKYNKNVNNIKYVCTMDSTYNITTILIDLSEKWLKIMAIPII